MKNIIILFLALLITGCSKKEDAVPQTIPSQQQADKFNGTWNLYYSSDVCTVGTIQQSLGDFDDYCTITGSYPNYKIDGFIDYYIGVPVNSYASENSFTIAYTNGNSSWDIQSGTISFNGNNANMEVFVKSSNGCVFKLTGTMVRF